VAGICHAAVVEGTPSVEGPEDSMDPVHAATAAAAPPASDLEVEVGEALVAAAEVLVAEDLEVEEALVAAAADVPAVVAAGADRGSPIHEKRIKGNEIGIANYNLFWSCMVSVCDRVGVVVRLLCDSSATPRTRHGWPKGDCLICEHGDCLIDRLIRGRPAL
jgi:hypothetical protein